MAVKQALRIADVGELGIIDWIRKNMPGNVSGLLRGIGDDAAVLRGGELITADMLIEGVHFEKKWHDPYLLGRKSLSVNLSDLAAMGGEPRCAFLSLAVSSDTHLKEVESFLSGFGQVAREHSMAVAGGDTCGSPGPMIIAVTVIGRAERPVLRSGARTGDILFVSGTLGDAALALKFLSKRGPAPGGKHFKSLQDKLLNPSPRISLGHKISQFASAMIDLSDGLAADLNNLCRESQVGARVFLDKIPISEAYKFQKNRVKSSKKGGDLYHEALYGGEDYELLFAAPPILKEHILRAAEMIPITEIGVIVNASEGIFLEAPEGQRPIKPVGDFSHF